MKTGLHTFVRKVVCLPVVLLAFYLPSYSQMAQGNYFEGGISVGPMIFLGDLGGHLGKGTTFLKDYNVNATKATYALFLAAHPSELFGLRLQVDMGKVDGSDNYIHGEGGLEEWRKNRNLDFKSNITEGMLIAEVYPTVAFEDDPTAVTGRLRPYGLIGVGVFHFNPMGSYTDPVSGQTTWVYLQPLRTEGEAKPYNLTQMNIPMGFGLKYYFSEKVNLSLEMLYRKTMTDYIDDVSTNYAPDNFFTTNLPAGEAQIASAMSNKSPLRGVEGSNYNPGDKRGNPNQKDAYFTFGFKLGFRIGESKAWDNSTRCPLLRF